MGQLRSSNTHILRFIRMYIYIKMYVSETMIGKKKVNKIRKSFNLLISLT